MTIQAIAKARALVARAERDLGQLTAGQRIDLLLDNMPSLRNTTEAAKLLDAAGLIRQEELRRAEN